MPRLFEDIYIVVKLIFCNSFFYSFLNFFCIYTFKNIKKYSLLQFMHIESMIKGITVYKIFIWGGIFLDIYGQKLSFMARRLVSGAVKRYF